jgi:hypothetical protein
MDNWFVAAVRWCYYAHRVFSGDRSYGVVAGKRSGNRCYNWRIGSTDHKRCDEGGQNRVLNVSGSQLSGFSQGISPFDVDEPRQMVQRLSKD